jgi:exosortase
VSLTGQLSYRNVSSVADFHEPAVSQPAVNGLQSVRNYSKYLAFVAFLTGSIAVWWRPLASTLQLALSSDARTYILLVLPVSIALVYLETSRNPAISGVGKWSGTLFLSAAILLRGLTAWDPNLSPGNGLALSMFALVIWWIGSVIICFGRQVFQSLLFPVCFLFLLVPLPAGVLTWITEFLQQQSAWAASILFHAAGVPVTLNGIVLSIPGLNIEVAQECSSIRSSTMLFVVTLILAHLFLRTRSAKTLLVLAVIPLSVAKNALRIFTIAELGTRVDPGFLTGNFHRHGGIIFLSLALLVIIFLLWVLRKGEIRAVSKIPASQRTSNSLSG